MKGDKKRKSKSIFVKNHSLNHNRTTSIPKYRKHDTGKYVRLDKSQFNNTITTANQQMFLLDAHMRGTSAKLLRPLGEKKTTTEALNEPTKRCPDASADETATVNLKQMEKMLNAVTVEHFEAAGSCHKGPNLQIDSIVPWGLSRKVTWKCQNCSYISKKHRLYKEVSDPKNPHKPGSKAADVNVGLAVGLASSSIGIAGATEILHSMNQPAPQRSGLKRQLDRTYDRFKELNESDMANRRKEIKHLQQLKGLGPDAPIRAEGDARYNNRLSSGGANPFQPATQQTYLIAEAETNKRQVIGTANFNKLCHKGGLLRKKGFDVKCPGGHDGCTANLAMEDNIGDERRAAKAAMNNMGDTKVSIGIITTDGDSQAFHGIQESQPQIPVENLRDTRHFKQTHRHNIKRNASKFSHLAIPYHDSKIRGKMEKRVADELSSRCDAEVRQAFTKYGTNESDMTSALHNTGKAILKCYQGDHSFCSMFSLVCDGTDKRSWAKPHLPTNMKKTMNFSEKDLVIMQQLIDYRLGPAAIHKTRLNTNSQQVEAANRGINKMNPKDITKSRNYEASVHSAILNINNRKSNAIVMKAEAMGVPVTPGSRTARQLLSADQQDLKSKSRQRSSDFINSRYKRKIEKYQLYDAKHAKDICEPVTYQKHLLDPKLKVKLPQDSTYMMRDSDAKDREPTPSTSSQGLKTEVVPAVCPGVAAESDVTMAPAPALALGPRVAPIQLRPTAPEVHVVTLNLQGKKTVKVSVIGKK